MGNNYIGDRKTMKELKNSVDTLTSALRSIMGLQEQEQDLDYPFTQEAEIRRLNRKFPAKKNDLDYALLDIIQSDAKRIVNTKKSKKPKYKTLLGYAKAYTKNWGFKIVDTEKLGDTLYWTAQDRDGNYRTYKIYRKSNGMPTRAIKVR